MKFFSKFALVCNLCFLATVVLRYLEIRQAAAEQTSDAIGFQPLASTIIILGYGSILVSILFLISLLLRLMRKKEINVAPWLIVVNLVFLLVQVIYFVW